MRHSALLSCAGLLFASALQAQTLSVYTYDSFVSDWGPGPALKTAFEAECACKLEFVTAGDGAALLARLRMEGPRSKADVVLGLDTNLMTAAAPLMAPHDLTQDYDLPILWEDPLFVPFDWSHFAFIGREGGPKPSSFEELAASEAKILIQDPRSSTPGLGLLMWVKAAYGEEAPRLWEALSDNILTVTPGWSEAWGMFLEGEADLVLSYTTSPAYSLIVEDDTSLQALPFSEGHGLQIEVASLLASSQNPELAKAFLAFLTSEKAQALLPETQWMHPVRRLVGQNPAWDAILQPETSLFLSPNEADALRGEGLEEWRRALSR